MDIWWKKVSLAELPVGGIEIPGDPKAWSKWNPFWRFQHDWLVFQVETTEPYWVFFADDNEQKVFKKKIVSNYFAARIGNSKIRFMAINNIADEESLTVTRQSGPHPYFDAVILSAGDVDETSVIMI